MFLCLHLPHLSLEVIGRGLEEPTLFAVAGSHGSRRWIHDCDRQARNAGVAPRMGLATAYALAPDLVVCPRNPEAEARALERLGRAAYAFSDRVSLSPPDALLLEIGASLRLFEGLERLCLLLSQELDQLGHRNRYAVAPTPAAARLMARARCYGQLGSLDPLPTVLANVPIEVCELPEPAITGFQGVGAHTLGKALALPRDGVGRRFGQTVFDYFDRLLGVRPDPQPPYRPGSHYESTLELPAEVHDAEGLLFAVHRMLEEMAAFLRLRDRSVQELVLRLRHAPPAQVTELRVGLLEPDRDAQRLSTLLRERFHALELPAPVRELTLCAPDLLIHQPTTADLFDRRRGARFRWARLRERLQSRLGSDAIFRLATHADHRPERAWQRIADNEGNYDVENPLSGLTERPLWLLETPRALEQPTRIVSGPERIESGWWDGTDVARDYFVAEGDEGHRLWVYRDRRRDRWYVHGIFG